MAELTKEAFQAAESCGREMLANAPRAVSARYDMDSGRVVVELNNGSAYAFPPRLVEDLQGADEATLGNVEVEGLGFNLHWPAIDVDLFVPALVSGVFGTKAWMKREFARAAGRSRTAPKAAAARANGAKGGRPRKSIGS